MEKIQEPKCDICGDETTLRYVKNSAVRFSNATNLYFDDPAGLFADCVRCGNVQGIESLQDKKLKEEIEINNK